MLGRTLFFRSLRILPVGRLGRRRRAGDDLVFCMVRLFFYGWGQKMDKKKTKQHRRLVVSHGLRASAAVLFLPTSMHSVFGRCTRQRSPCLGCCRDRCAAFLNPQSGKWKVDNGNWKIVLIEKMFSGLCSSDPFASLLDDAGARDELVFCVVRSVFYGGGAKNRSKYHALLHLKGKLTAAATLRTGVTPEGTTSERGAT